MAVEEASSSGGGGEDECGAWTREQEKAFENAVATMGGEKDGNTRWEKLAEAVEGKTPEEVRRHYELLAEDVDGIESGRVPLPTYAANGAAEEGGGGGGKKGGGGGGTHGDKGSAKSAEQERRKDIAWTEDEHRVQKERMEAEDMYVFSADGKVLSAPEAKPWPNKPPKCTDCAPLFMKAYLMRGAGAVIHSHGIETCLASMLDPGEKEFRVNPLAQASFSILWFFENMPVDTCFFERIT